MSRILTYPNPIYLSKNAVTYHRVSASPGLGAMICASTCLHPRQSLHLSPEVPEASVAAVQIPPIVEAAIAVGPQGDPAAVQKVGDLQRSSVAGGTKPPLCHSRVLWSAP